MSLILPANSLTGGYEIDNSLRFDDGSSDYLSRTPASAGNRKTWTWSSWVKLSDETTNPIFGCYPASDTYQNDIAVYSSNSLRVSLTNNGTAYQGNLTTNQVFRDFSAWYHIVVAIDTTQATSSDRMKLYINGSQVTSFSTETYPSQNYESYYNSTIPHNIGLRQRYSEYFNGYIAEAVFIDGQALTPTDFGEFDQDTGIWIPKKYTGSYGTNGFFLDFENSGSFGADQSGNGNNFTVNNLTSIDQTTDTPTNNFCLPNFLAKGSDIVLAEGNTSITRSTASWNSCMATIMVDTGKWYWEQKVSSLGIINCGITKSTQDGTSHSSVDAGRIMYSSNGTIYTEGFAGVGDIATGTTFTTNDIIGIVLDCDAGTIAFYKNGTLVYTVSDSEISTVELSPAWGLYSATWLVNFGNPAFTISSSNTDDAGYGNFEYSVPSGYYSLCTKNLAEFG